MKIAMPTLNGVLCPHFGHCAEFTFVEVNPDTKEVIGFQCVPAPEHQPGLLPEWIHQQGADVVIAGGMGFRAQQLFAKSGIEVVVGAPAACPTEIAKAYVDGTLEIGENICDH